MKKILLMIVALLTLGAQMETSAKLKWDWDGKLSGNKVIDEYLMKIDSLYKEVIAFREFASSFELKRDSFTAANGKEYIICCGVSNGQLLTQGRMNWQYAEVKLQDALLIAKMASAGLLTANASLELPKLGLKALKFAKYVKGGPAVIKEGTATIKEIENARAESLARWRDVKTGSIDPASLNYFSEEALKTIQKCCFIKEKIKLEEQYTDMVNTVREKTDEEIAKEQKELNEFYGQASITPEDKSKQIDNAASDEEFDKELNG